MADGGLMILLVDVLLAVAAIALLLPAMVFFVECMLALLPRRTEGLLPSRRRPSIAVLMPAHNEELSIERALSSVTSQLRDDDRLLVIADHCGDRTAEMARRAGATVIKREDPAPRGKGYALDEALRFLADAPPQVVVVVDADCLLAPGTLDLIAHRVASSGRPVQASYVLDLPPHPDLTAAVSAFAFLVRNVVRPLGLHRLGLPCHLMGTGMAFPWRLTDRASMAGDHIGDDLQLGLDLLIAGHPSLLCTDASVTSWLPPRRAAAAQQRRRWEHGHLAIMVGYLPRLVAQALRQRRSGLLAIALDLSVPPLSLLVILLAATTGAAALAAMLGASRAPAGLLAIGGGLVLVAVLAAWFRFCRPWLPVSALLAAPFYVLWKVPLYWQFLVRRQRGWGGRTERGDR
jgi:glycosyltransferase involved in cell wall biosynthesis